MSTRDDLAAVTGAPAPAAAATSAETPLPSARVPGWRATFALGLAVAAVVEVVLSLALYRSSGVTWNSLVQQHDVIAAIIGVFFAAVGAFVVSYAPRHALAWIFIAIGQLLALSDVLTAYSLKAPAPPAAGFAALTGDVIWLPAMAMGAGLITTLFPDGRPVSPGARPLVWIAAIAVGVVSLLLPFAQPTDLTPPRDNPLAPGQPLEDVLTHIAFGAVFVSLLCGLGGAAFLVIRMRRTSGSERHRIAWFFVAFGLVVICQVLPVNVIVPTIANALFPVALGVAMLRHGLFDGDRLLNRTLVYGVLTALVAGLFGLVAGLASSSFVGATAGAVVAAVVVALGLTPARDRVQRAVDRVLYGERRDPYLALTGLGQRLSAAIAAEDLLPIIVHTVVDSLRLPYAAITLEGESSPATAHGSPSADSVDLPLRHAGSPVGTLTVGLRPGQRFLDPGDERLLTSVAQQAGVAADGVRLTRELRRSRDDLAVARDEERHRIRRDLHDGLGPTLAGVALGIGAARRGAANPETADLLRRLQEEVNGSLADVKRLVADLRPTTLEQLGLFDALAQYADTVSLRSDGQLKIVIDAPVPLASLPAEVEVAAYRIAMEALTNVTRHAGANRCTIRLSTYDHCLHVRVTDNGRGIPNCPHSGLGLHSMAERAAELGGTCQVSALSEGGTTVVAELPLAGPA